MLLYGSGSNDCILLHAAYGCDSLVDVLDVDAAAKANAPSAERLRKTQLQGDAFGKTTAQIWGNGFPNLVYPVAVGYAARTMELPVVLTATIYVQAFANNLISAAVRLVSLGQSESQIVLAGLTPLCDQIAQDTGRAGLEALTRMEVLPQDRIIGVETRGCPHTAIREDASINLAAIAQMQVRHPDLEVVLIESGGNNLSVAFSTELADFTIYAIDVAPGEEIPRKGGPAITKSDLLVINKTDLAPHVGASLDGMRADSSKMRGTRPFVFCSLRDNEGEADVLAFICKEGGLRPVPQIGSVKT